MCNPSGLLEPGIRSEPLIPSHAARAGLREVGVAQMAQILQAQRLSKINRKCQRRSKVLEGTEFA